MKNIWNSIYDYARKLDRDYRRFLYNDIISLRSTQGNGKHLLLSYITHPFRAKPNDPVFFTHTNTWECLQIAKNWLKYGYNVDIIDWDNTSFVPKKDYSIFIDIHSNMERISPLLNKDCKKILHITGAHWKFQNSAEMRRLDDLKERKGFHLKPRRQVPQCQGIEYADCATILGNKFTRETFSFSNKQLYPLPISTTIEFPFMKKNFNYAGKRFVWLGSSGMVHKGLDLVLDAFSQLPDFHLTVCGPVKNEPDFEDAYSRELYRTKNITTAGFVDLKSMQFQEIIRNSGLLIYPSCSEGQAGSVVTCMHAGLIPVISYESGVDVKDFGAILPACSVDDIKSTVTKISQNPSGVLEQMSKRAWEYARAQHTRKKFAETYDMFAKKIITE